MAGGGGGGRLVTAGGSGFPRLYQNADILSLYHGEEYLISSIRLSEAAVHQKNPKTVPIRTYIGRYQLLREWPK